MRQRTPPAWRRLIARERRLLAMGAISLALHLLVLERLSQRPPHSPQSLPSMALALRLHGAAPPSPARPALPSAAAPASAAPATRPARPQRIARATTATAHTKPASPAAPAATAEHSAAPTGVPGWDVLAEDPAAAAAAEPHRPGMQAVEAPPPARLEYAVTVGAAQGASTRAAGNAAIDWRTSAQGYRLQLTGENGVMGELDSRGAFSDGGLIPLEVGSGDGSAGVRFDWTTARASFARSGQNAGLSSDSQDRASLLMRLAGIGLAAASQLDGEIELPVAGADTVARVRFDNLGPETLATALGPLATVHLRQRPAAAGPAAPQLDIWLAPARSWYPVQLQLTAIDGSVVVQTITAIIASPP